MAEHFAAPRQFESRKDGTGLIFEFAGELVTTKLGSIWQQAWQEARQASPGRPTEALTIDLSRVDYCDSGGATLILSLARRQREANQPVEIVGANQRVRELIDWLDRPAPPKQERAVRPKLIERMGAETLALFRNIGQILNFTVEATLAVAQALRHPRSVRWSNVMAIAETTGVNALPILGLLGFLIGLIMAIQAEVQLRMFGADIYIANMLSLSVLRELGPLMTAVILAGRSGSAFAAEIGTMKVNEEIDALTTMGLDPMQFLVVPRLIASVCMVPLMTAFMNLFALAGGLVVFLSLGYPTQLYINQIEDVTRYSDLLGGLWKSVIFGIMVSGVGCLRGLQTGPGALAVGLSTTGAVVSGIILIIFTDMIFTLLFSYLGI